MRVTTTMINNSMLNQITSNKNSMYSLEEQYNSGKRIQRPSDDPIIAVRSLKLRSTITEVTQYLEKNIPDARSWMELTEGSLKNMNTIFTNVYADMSKGANDTLTTSDRSTILANLNQFREQIYNEANADNAGRYVFAGYKTNNSITFNEKEAELKYTITEKISGSDITQLSKVIGGYAIDEYDANNPDASLFETSPSVKDDIFKIQLGYSAIESGSINSDTITYTVVDEDGNEEVKSISELGFNVTEVFVEDSSAYDVAVDEIRYIAKTGEVIMGSEVYEELRTQGDGHIGITYNKNEFEAGEVKPEHYYDCVVEDALGEKIDYKYSEQEIFYEINFAQKIRVNSTLDSVIGNDFARTIENINNIVKQVSKIETDLEDVEKLLSDDKITVEQREALEKFKVQKEAEYAMQSNLMTRAFEDGLKLTSDYQEQVNISVSDLGSRLSRLNLVEDRLETQSTSYTELLSENEDADIVDTYIKLSAAESIYNASLQIATKIAQTSLLDYL